MAVVRVEFCWGPSVQQRRDAIEAIADAVVRALRVPPGDPTVVGVLRPPEDVVFPEKVGDHYTIVTMTLFAGRTTDTKRLLYGNLVQALSSVGVPSQDVLIVLDEVPAVNWGVDGGIPANETDVGFDIEV